MWSWIATTSIPFFAHSLENGGDLFLTHGYFTGKNRILLSTSERRPGIQVPASVDCRTVLLHGKIVASNSDFVNITGPFPFMPDGFGKLPGVQRSPL
jgi:hypothetical protein